MATADDFLREHKSASDSDDSGQSGSNDGNGEVSKAEEPVEWLATSRARRATAGNLMKSIIANEDPEDDLELLFVEDDNDPGFTDLEDHASDVQMNSSDDEEEEENGTDDLEGEKELQRDIKGRRRRRKLASKKRKGMDHIPLKFRKRVRIDKPEWSIAGSSAVSTTSTTPAPKPRPKKKSERASWLPSPADMPTRASKRETTMLSKEQLHNQMVEREARRKKQLKLMAEREKRKEALKKPPMTQEERLREAAVVERRNAKSLNRWEESEKQREEERKKKLAALHNRKLEGPVVTFWSGIQDSGGKGVPFVVEEAKKSRRKKARDGASAASTPPAPSMSAVASAVSETTMLRLTPALSSNLLKPVSTNMLASRGASAGATPPSGTSETPSPVLERPPQLPQASGLTPPPAQLPPSDSRPAKSSFLAMPGTAPPVLGTPRNAPGLPQAAATGARFNGLALPNPGSASSPLSLPPLTASSGSAPALSRPATSTPALTQASPTHTTAMFAVLPSPSSPPKSGPTTITTPSTSIPRNTPLSALATSNIPGSESRDKQVENCGDKNHKPDKNETSVKDDRPTDDRIVRRLIILQNFDHHAIKDKTVQMKILFNKKMSKLPKPSSSPPCVITNHPAKYRDPKTGLPYCNAYAFRMIRKLYGGEYRFSHLLGAYVGNQAFAARGVPLRFLKPDATRVFPKEAQPPPPTLESQTPPTPTAPANVIVPAAPQTLATLVSQPALAGSGAQHSSPAPTAEPRFRLKPPFPATPTTLPPHPQPRVISNTPSTSQISSIHQARPAVAAPQVKAPRPSPTVQSQFQPTTTARLQPVIPPPQSYQPKKRATPALAAPRPVQAARAQTGPLPPPPSQFQSNAASAPTQPLPSVVNLPTKPAQLVESVSRSSQPPQTKAPGSPDLGVAANPVTLSKTPAVPAISAAQTVNSATATVTASQAAPTSRTSPQLVQPSSTASVAAEVLPPVTSSSVACENPFSAASAIPTPLMLTESRFELHTEAANNPVE